jgi:hypothetical protein
MIGDMIGDKCHCGGIKEENQIECFYCHNITVCTRITIEGD